MAKVNVKGITTKKTEDFSQWYSELVERAELADLRYNIKGFVCYLPWATRSIKKMFDKYEQALDATGHEPLTMPSLIPESNFHLEADHVEGFTPEVFWVTGAGKDTVFEERLALRPTSETALYKMYAYWIRSYKDLPFKRYQSCQVWRYEGKATRPFFRAREFHWIEAHNVFATLEEAKAQVIEDMEITYDMLEGEFAIPIIFFQRPEWDKFPGAVHTYAADALTDSGKVIQLPSTHLLGQNFSKPFNVTFTDKDEKEKFGFITCYGPAISRIYGAMIAILGDDQGLILPFDLAPKQIVIVPIFHKSDTEGKVLAKAQELQKMLKGFVVHVDDRDYKSPGEKYNEWELKGVPIRIEIGPRDIENNQVVVVDRLEGKKEIVAFTNVQEYVAQHAKSFTQRIKDKHKKRFDEQVKIVDTIEQAKEVIDNNGIACCGMCSIDMSSFACAEKIEKGSGGFVRGKMVKPDKHKVEKCLACGKPATATVYIARAY